MGKVKWLELWWQMHVMSLPEQDVQNIRPHDFCWTECTVNLLGTIECTYEMYSNFCTGLLQTRRVPGGWGSQTLRQLAHEGLRFSILCTSHLNPPKEIFLVLISVRGWVNHSAKVWLEGIKPMIFLLVAQCFNQLCHYMPHSPSRMSRRVQ